MARPRKPTITLEEVAAALHNLQAKGEKVSGESLALQLTHNRGANDYKTPELRRKHSVSSRTVIRRLVELEQKHGETEITAKLQWLIRREKGRQNARSREVGEPVPHQGTPPAFTNPEPLVNAPEGPEPATVPNQVGSEPGAKA